MYTVRYTKEEITALTQLIDIAVKGGGLNVAEAAVVLYKKLQVPEDKPEPVSKTASMPKATKE